MFIDLDSPLFSGEVELVLRVDEVGLVRALNMHSGFHGFESFLVNFVALG